MSDTPLVDLCARLWPLHRTLCSDGMDVALDLVAQALPVGATSLIERYPPRAPAWTWVVPERWVVHEATLAWDDGTPICTFADHPLHLASYSIPFEGDAVSWDAVQEHLHVGPQEFPDALPWIFNYYLRTWGFCLSWNQHAKLRDRLRRSEPTPATFRVRIRTEFRLGPGDGLAVCTATVPPAPGRPKGRPSVLPREILVCADLCHPYQVNDSITGAVAAIEVARRLVATPLPPGSRTVRFLFVPEVIGSLCYLAHHAEVIARTDGAVFSEMLGTPGPLVLQESRGGKADRMTRIAKALLPQTFSVPFRSPLTARNDEIVLNGPGVNIPTVALTRYPYPEYHTTADRPEILSETQLRDAVDSMEVLIRTAAVDWVPRRTFTGPLFLSRYGLWVDWRTNPKLNAAMEAIMLRLEGDQSVFDIAQAVDLPFQEVYTLLDTFRERGLVTEAL